MPREEDKNLDEYDEYDEYDDDDIEDDFDDEETPHVGEEDDFDEYDEYDDDDIEDDFDDEEDEGLDVVSRQVTNVLQSLQNEVPCSTVLAFKTGVDKSVTKKIEMLCSDMLSTLRMLDDTPPVALAGSMPTPTERDSSCITAAKQLLAAQIDSLTKLRSSL